MGFSFPVVPDQSGQILGGALANAFNTYRSAKMDPLQDQLARLDYANKYHEAIMSGWNPGPMPQEPAPSSREPAPAGAPSSTPASAPSLSSDYLSRPYQGLASSFKSGFDKASAAFPNVTPSNAPSPGAFSLGEGFHSSLLDGAHPSATPAMPAFNPSVAARRPSTAAPAGQPAGDTEDQSPGAQLAELFRQQRRYTAAPGGGYWDAQSPYVRAGQLQALENIRKTESDINMANARADYFRNYGAAGGRWSLKTGPNGQVVRIHPITGESEDLTYADGSPVMAQGRAPQKPFAATINGKSGMWTMGPNGPEPATGVEAGAPEGTPRTQLQPIPHVAATRTPTPTQTENLAEKMADNAVAGHNGNIGDPAAFLRSPEGQRLAAQGVTVAHLAGALGRYGQKQTSQAAGLAKSGASTVAGARAAMDTLSGNTVNEAQLDDAHLWELKKKEGMSNDQATAYVHNRQKP